MVCLLITLVHISYNQYRVYSPACRATIGIIWPPYFHFILNFKNKGVGVQCLKSTLWKSIKQNILILVYLQICMLRFTLQNVCFIDQILHGITIFNYGCLPIIILSNSLLNGLITYWKCLLYWSKLVCI